MCHKMQEIIKQFVTILSINSREKGKFFKNAMHTIFYILFLHGQSIFKI